MSGVEAAGFVLAAVPIVIECLQLYSEGLNRTAVLFRKRKHVEKLSHALLTQRALLGENLKSVLIESGVEDGHLLLDDPWAFSGIGDVDEKLRHYFGKEAFVAYMYALAESRTIVEEIAKSIEGYGPVSKLDHGNLLDFIQLNNTVRSGRFDLGRRVKLMLRKEELEKKIVDLDKSADKLERLQKLVSKNRQSLATGTWRKANKLATSLQKARSLAHRLYIAISKGWIPGCHDTHEAKLFLENRVQLTDHYAPRAKDANQRNGMHFRLVFSAAETTGQTIWHEALVEGLEDDDEGEEALIMDGLAHNTTFRLNNSVSRVSFALPDRTSRLPISTAEVDNICVVVTKAALEGKHLRFYLLKQRRMRCSHDYQPEHTVQNPRTTVSLHCLLSQSSSSTKGRLSLRDRMFLALNLASNLLQLHDTEWLGSSWSKDAVHFVNSLPNSNNSRVTPGGFAAEVPSVDTRNPLVSLLFQNPDPYHPREVRTNAKAALLELGILLLELWHETTLEARLSQTPPTTDYFGRLRVAWEWLEDISNPPPDSYNAAIAQCIKCFFGGTPCSFDWGDPTFRRVICEDVIEPLWKNCRQWV